MLSLVYQVDLLSRGGHGAHALADLEAQSGHSHVLTLDASYGISSHLTVGVVAPFVYKSQQVTLGAGEARRSLAGPGDPAILVKLALVGAEELRPDALRIGLLGGVKLPFGRSRVQDELGTLPPSFQLGSGAFDLLAGLNASLGVFRKATLFGSLIYRHPTESSLGYRFGSSLAAALDLRLVHLWPVALSVGPRLTWAARDREDGNPEPGSGGGRLLAHLGLSYHASASFFAGLDLLAPVWSGLDGDPLASRLALALTLSLAL